MARGAPFGIVVRACVRAMVLIVVCDHDLIMCADIAWVAVGSCFVGGTVGGGGLAVGVLCFCCTM